MTPYGPLPWLRRLPALALAFVLVLLLAVGAGAASPPITISVSPETVDPGSDVTVDIRLHNVKDAQLNGEALKGDKIKKTVTIFKDTTFTVTGTDKKGKPLTQSATAHVTVITAVGGAGPTPAPLADLVMNPGTYALEPIPADSKTVTVTISFDFWNRGAAAITTPYLGSGYQDDVLIKTFPSTLLLSQQTQHGTWRLTLPVGKTYRFKITLDVENRIPEITKDNNSMTVWVSTSPLAEKTIGDLKASPFLLKDKPSPFLLLQQK
jgi:hypothetical protein